jgi:hypothetical protein
MSKTEQHAFVVQKFVPIENSFEMVKKYIFKM